MEYKVGGKVRIKTLEEFEANIGKGYLKVKRCGNFEYFGDFTYFSVYMFPYFGKTLIIKNIQWYDVYQTAINTIGLSGTDFYWKLWMFSEEEAQRRFYF